MPLNPLPPLTLSDPRHERGGVSRGHAFHHHALARNHRGVLGSCHDDHILPPGGRPRPWGRGQASKQPHYWVSVQAVPRLMLRITCEAGGAGNIAGFHLTDGESSRRAPQSSFSWRRERSNLASGIPPPFFLARPNPSSRQRTIRVMGRLGTWSWSQQS